jgi:hypothetical protein
MNRGELNFRVLLRARVCQRVKYLRSGLFQCGFLMTDLTQHSTYDIRFHWVLDSPANGINI